MIVFVNLTLLKLETSCLQIPNNTISTIFHFQKSEQNKYKYKYKVLLFPQSQQQRLTNINRRCFASRVYPVEEIIE